MQWLTLVSEDYGVQRLRTDNRRPVVARAVGPVSAYPATHPVRLGEHPEIQRQHVEIRRCSERRKRGDRRRKQVPVILDTRSKHNRRVLQDGHRSQPRRHINVYA